MIGTIDQNAAIQEQIISATSLGFAPSQGIRHGASRNGYLRAVRSRSLITPTGVNAVAVQSRTEARVMVSLHKRQGRDDFGPDPSVQIGS
jgi:hypothetical protein